MIHPEEQLGSDYSKTVRQLLVRAHESEQRQAALDLRLSELAVLLQGCREENQHQCEELERGHHALALSSHRALAIVMSLQQQRPGDGIADSDNLPDDSPALLALERRVRALECGKQGGSLWDTLDSPLLDQMEPTKPQLSHLEEVGKPRDVGSMLVELQNQVNYLVQMPRREVGCEGGGTPPDCPKITEAAAVLFAGFEERIEASLQHVLDKLRKVEERVSEQRTTTTAGAMDPSEVTSSMKSVPPRREQALPQWKNGNGGVKGDLRSMSEDPRGMQVLAHAWEREPPQSWTGITDTG